LNLCKIKLRYNSGGKILKTNFLNKKFLIGLVLTLTIFLLGISFLYVSRTLESKADEAITEFPADLSVDNEVLDSTWKKDFYHLTGGTIDVPPPLSTVSNMNAPDPTHILEGAHSLKIVGSKNEKVVATKTFDVAPATRYMLVYQIKIEDRQCSHYNDPANELIENGSKFAPADSYATGFFCGQYAVTLKEPDSSTHNDQREVSKSWLDDQIYQRSRNLNWYMEQTKFTTANDSSKVKVSFIAKGFVGNLYVDNLRVYKVPSFVHDANLTGVSAGSSKMTLTRADNGPSGATLPLSPVYVETNNSVGDTRVNGAKFAIDSNSIQGFAKKDGTHLFDLYASDETSVNPNFNKKIFENLSKKTSASGTAYYNQDDYTPLNQTDNNVQISFGADSTAIIKFKESDNPDVPKYYTLRLKNTGNVAMQDSLFYENGTLLYRTSDKDKGFFFSPVIPNGDLKYPSTVTNGLPDDIAKYGDLPRWPASTDGLKNTLKMTDNWYLDYHAKSGDVFILSIFPPKDFDTTQWCTDRVTAGFDFSIYNPKYTYTDFEYNANYLSRDFGAIVLWMGIWDNVDVSDPTKVLYEDPTDQQLFFPNNGKTVLGATLGPLRSRDTQRFDVPTAIANPQPGNTFATTNFDQRLKDYINILHSKGLKVLFYTAAGFYYPENTNFSVSEDQRYYEELQGIFNRYNFDGIYFDGYKSTDLANNLRFVRTIKRLRTNAKMGSKEVFWTQHNSGNPWFYSASGFGGPNGDAFSTNFPVFDHNIWGVQFRVPFLDAYPDTILTGENLRHTETQAVNNAYNGFGTSNSIIDLITETRFADESSYDASASYIPRDVMTGQDLIDQQIKVNPQVATDKNKLLDPNNILGRIWFYYGNNPFRFAYKLVSWVNQNKPAAKTLDLFKNSTRNKMTFLDTDSYFKTINNACLSTTCGNRICQIDENYKTCPKDCAPLIKSDSGNILSVSKQNENQMLKAPEGQVVNWLIGDKKPLFDFHLDFNEKVPADLSYNKLSADYTTENIYRPKPDNVANPQSFNFSQNEFGNNSQTYLRYNHGGYLNGRTDFDVDNPSYDNYVTPPPPDIPQYLHQILAYDNTDFSAFARVKLDSGSNTVNPVIKEGLDRYGMGLINNNNNKMQVYFHYRKDRRTSNLQLEEEIFSSVKSTEINFDGQFHQIGFAYENNPQMPDADQKILRLYFDGLPIKIKKDDGQLVDYVSNIQLMPMNQYDVNLEIGRESYIYIPAGKITPVIGSRFLKGSIDDLFISPYKLSNETIKSLYNNNLGAISSNDPLLSGVDLKAVKAILKDGSNIMTSDYKGVDIIKTQDKYSAPSGSEITVTLKVQNNNGSPISQVNVTDSLGDNLTYISSLTGPSPALVANNLIWSIAEQIPTGGFKELIYKAKVD